MKKCSALYIVKVVLRFSPFQQKKVFHIASEQLNTAGMNMITLNIQMFQLQYRQHKCRDLAHRDRKTKNPEPEPFIPKRSSFSKFFDSFAVLGLQTSKMNKQFFFNICYILGCTKTTLIVLLLSIQYTFFKSIHRICSVLHYRNDRNDVTRLVEEK